MDHGIQKSSIKRPFSMISQQRLNPFNLTNYLGPIPNSEHFLEEQHVAPSTEPAAAVVPVAGAVASAAFGGELADAGAGWDCLAMLHVMG